MRSLTLSCRQTVQPGTSRAATLRHPRRRGYLGSLSEIRGHAGSGRSRQRFGSPRLSRGVSSPASQDNRAAGSGNDQRGYDGADRAGSAAGAGP